MGDSTLYILQKPKIIDPSTNYVDDQIRRLNKLKTLFSITSTEFNNVFILPKWTYERYSNILSFMLMIIVNKRGLIDKQFIYQVSKNEQDRILNDILKHLANQIIRNGITINHLFEYIKTNGLNTQRLVDLIILW